MSEQVTTLKRETTSKALLNTDDTGLIAYRMRRDRERKQAQVFDKIDHLICEMTVLREQLHQITDRLMKLENKND